MTDTDPFGAAGDPVADVHDDEEDGYRAVLQEDPVTSVVDEADTTTFDNRTEFDDPLHDLDSSLTLDGGAETSRHHGLHDVGDVTDLIDDVGDLLT